VSCDISDEPAFYKLGGWIVQAGLFGSARVILAAFY